MFQHRYLPWRLRVSGRPDVPRRDSTQPTCSQPAVGAAGCDGACAAAGGRAGPPSAKAAPMMTSRLSAGERRDARAWEGGRGGRCRQSKPFKVRHILKGVGGFRPDSLLQDRLRKTWKQKVWSP